MPRLFIALRPPAPIRSQCLALMRGIEHARWQDDDQLHLTLRYIGDVDAAVADAITAQLAQIRHPLPSMRLFGCGIFDTRGVPNTLWAGVTPDAPLTALHQKLDALLVGLGLPAEPRAFVPHITLARLSRATSSVAPFLAEHASLSSPAFSAANMTLYASTLSDTGSQYTPVAHYPL